MLFRKKDKEKDQQPQSVEEKEAQVVVSALHNGGAVDEKDVGTATNTTLTANDAASDKDKDKDKKDEPTLPPVSFFALFRYATKFEIFLNIIGLVAAAGAGAAQPLMTLLFGDLTRAFVEFGKALEAAFGTQTPEAWAAFEAARETFKKSAADSALYLTFIGIGIAVTTYVFMTTWSYTGEVNAKRIREHYLRAVLRQDIAFFDKVGAGEVATRIQTDTHLVQEGISEKVALATSFFSAFITGFVLAFTQQWKLSLALSSILPGIMIAGGLITTVPASRKVQQLAHVADGGTLAEEVISTVRITQAFGAQTALSKMYDVFINKAHKVERGAGALEGSFLGLMFFVVYASYGLAFHFGTTLIIKGETDIGTVLNVFFAIMIGAFSISMIAPSAQAITTASSAAAKLFDTIDRVPPIDSASPDGLKPPSINGQIELKDVKFNYPARPDVPVLKGLNLSFPAGKTCALVGASGSGKSTIVALVERFYDPLEGNLTLDGVDLKDLNLKWLRSQIGLVSQEPTLFSTTIRKNVEHGLIGTPFQHASDEERFKAVKDACIKANADNFISKLPNGYDTMVGERGFLLSGGQKQRIAIARAIASDPRVLLLDEATSALDTQSESVVQNALDKAAAGRTTIVIAHRLSTIKDADQIFVMGDGQVLEQGTHLELLANAEGPYARLVQAQKLREQEHSGTDTGSATPNALATAEEHLAKEQEEVEKRALNRVGTEQSLSSQILEERKKEKEGQDEEEAGGQSFYYLMKRLGYINRSSWRSYAVGFAAAICNGMTYPAFGLVYGPAIMGFQTDDSSELRRNGDRSALWFFIISILASAAAALQNIFFSRSAANLGRKLRSLLIRAILRHDIAYFDDEKNSSGSLTSGLSENPQKINGLAGVTLGTIAQSCVTLIGGSIIGLAYGWKLALVGIACIPLVITSGVIELKVVMQKDESNKKAHAESAQVACEAAGAIRTVASLTREEDCCDIYSKSLEEPLKKTQRASLIGTFWYAMTQAVAFWVIALAFWYGSILVAQLEYNTSEFFIVLMAVVFASTDTGRVFAWVPDISKSRMASIQVLKMLDNVPEIDSASNEGKLLERKEVKGRITFTDVHYRYPTRPGVKVLRGFNLTVEPGTHVALVGASGCGKSTVFQLVERFYDPISGTVAIDGQNLQDLNVQSYRRNLALVSQEPTLYAGSIKFNVLLGATKPHNEVTQEEIEKACAEANILDFIKSLPDGFETPVGGKGSQLSGGQKQRIAIARALIRNPAVLLLDEATSALDSNSERVVQDALDSAARGRTTISVAHRLSTIQQCDMIHFVHEGRIVESGTHEELLQKRGRYAEYVLLQDLSGH